MTTWKIRTARSGRFLGTFHGTKKGAYAWAKRYWKINIEVVSEKIDARNLKGKR